MCSYLRRLHGELMSRWDNTLFFVGRHGETASNEQNIYRSWSNRPEAQLNDDGRRCIKEAGEYLVAQNAPIELIITDSLDRCLESAEILAHVLGVDRIVTVRGLHPLNMGDYTGKDKDKYPIEPFLKNPAKRIPGGETVNEFDQRQFAAFSGIMPIVDSLPTGHVLVEGHGSTISFLHNRVFDKGEPVVGYEGLVDPGGLLAAERDGFTPLTRVRSGKVARESADHAGYMELTGATKDGDCQRVEVAGGISKELGCCNDFKPQGAGVTAFRCGSCRFVTDKGGTK
jgi:broad specificity phosphatase PhoE